MTSRSRWLATILPTGVILCLITLTMAVPGIAAQPDPSDPARLSLTLRRTEGGKPCDARIAVVNEIGCVIARLEFRPSRTQPDAAAVCDLKAGARGWVRFVRGSRIREARFGPLPPGGAQLDAVWEQLAAIPEGIEALEAWACAPLSTKEGHAKALTQPLGKLAASRAREMLGAHRLSLINEERRSGLEAKSITLNGKTLRWMSQTFGEAPADGRSLWISMHGGGNAPSGVNDRQWTNQSRLYQPAEGIYVAPRAPTDTWNLWHEAHVDPLFQRLIEDHVAMLGVSPDKVYLLGYSAGGDGVWQLAPRMADRFAAAAIMAGHPNEASLLGVRNLPFALFMGGNDTAYGRSKIATERAAQLAELARQDPGGYTNFTRIYEGLGHWMNRKDAEGVPWMAQFRRNPWPRKIVWLQDDVLHRRFYWLHHTMDDGPRVKQKIIASVVGGSIVLEGDVPAGLGLGLSDELIDLDAPLTVTVNGRKAFEGKVKRCARDIWEALSHRADPSAAFTAFLKL